MNPASKPIPSTQTIAFTGGHHNSALVVAQALRHKGFKIVWFGHQFSMTQSTNLSAEFQEVTQVGFPFIHLNSPRFYGNNLLQLIKLFPAIVFSWRQLKQHSVSLVVSFGGYLAVPVVMAAWMLRIPCISHEQTLTLGNANRLLYRFVKRLYLTWPIATLAHATKCQVIGLPIIQTSPLTKPQLNAFLATHLSTPQAFVDSTRPLLVVTGGKQGAHAINRLVRRTLPQLLIRYNVLHQSGDNSQTQDYQKLLRLRNQLPTQSKGRYIVFPYLRDFTRCLDLADMIVGRSGAHTTYETILARKKIVTIPLPFSYQAEQQKQAYLLERLSLGAVLEQPQATPERLIQTLDQLEAKPLDNAVIDHFICEHMPAHATETMVREITQLLKSV